MEELYKHHENGQWELLEKTGPEAYVLPHPHEKGSFALVGDHGASKINRKEAQTAMQDGKPFTSFDKLSDKHKAHFKTP